MHSAFPRTFLKNDSRKQICKTKVKRLGKLSNNYFISLIFLCTGLKYLGMYKKVISIVSSKVNLCKAESNRERIAFGPLLITVLFLALKKLVFLKKKFFQKKNFFFTFFLCNFSVRTLQCFQFFFFF